MAKVEAGGRAGRRARCAGCGELDHHGKIARHLSVCRRCGYHFRLSVDQRLRLLLDRGSFDFAFMGGSMGSAVGEKLTRLIERALGERLPLVIVSASGGARMQEGIYSLMQMAKLTAALARLRAAGIPYISILTDPTTGGVAASIALLGDVNLAEPGALIGFAGPRVVAQTISAQLPEGFQRSEFLLKHGMLDGIVERRALRATLARLLRLLVPRSRHDPRSGTA